MSSPKGKSKHPQSVVYKDGGSKLVGQSEVEALKADGWCDNPKGTVDAEAPDASKEADTPPTDTEVSEVETDESTDEAE